MRLFILFSALCLSGCAHTITSRAPDAAVTVKLIGLNDFHGHIEPPKQSVTVDVPGGTKVRVPFGGAAYLATAIDQYRAKNPNTLVVSAGDLIGGSPITSSIFLDEPTIGVMNRIGLDFNAVGNHEFDRGRKELVRMQNGGCEKHTVREPCQVERPFSGAKFGFLAANVVTESGATLFPATAMRRFGKGRQAVDVGLIGLTLKDTPTLVTPTGVAGLEFQDEAETINALVPKLRKQGADAIVVLIHQGMYTTVGANDKSCGGASGTLLAVLANLTPDIDVIVSGHSHWAYICDYGQVDKSRRFLVTSAGQWGQYITDIDLTIDPVTQRVVGKAANNVLVQSEPYVSPAGPVAVHPAFQQFSPRPDIAAYVGKYSIAVQTEKERIVGKVGGTARKPAMATHETALGNLIADAQAAATRAAGAQFALMNNTGIRADLMTAADQTVTFGTLFNIQPFANELKTLTLTGAELKLLLEQQLDGQSFDQTFSPSSELAFAFDKAQPIGQRISDIMVNGNPLVANADYRFTVNSFLASGGDSFTILRQGRNLVTGGLDLDAMEAWIAAQPVLLLPAVGRIRDLSPVPRASSSE